MGRTNIRKAIESQSTNILIKLDYCNKKVSFWGNNNKLKTQTTEEKEFANHVFEYAYIQNIQRILKIQWINRKIASKRFDLILDYQRYSDNK